MKSQRKMPIPFPGLMTSLMLCKIDKRLVHLISDLGTGRSVLTLKTVKKLPLLHQMVSGSSFVFHLGSLMDLLLSNVPLKLSYQVNI